MDATDGLVVPGHRVTIFGPFGRNDQELQILGNGFGGFLTFHVLCSDDDMNGPDDCEKLKGNGKKSNSGINLWVLDGLVSSNGAGFNCRNLGGPIFHHDRKLKKTPHEPKSHVPLEKLPRWSLFDENLCTASINDLSPEPEV